MTPATERKTLEAGLSKLDRASEPSQFAVPRDEWNAVLAAARKYLATLPAPRTVFKATGVKPSGERMALSFDAIDGAIYAADSWLKKGMQHVAIFRDEV